jgi:hypothetical protein
VLDFSVDFSVDISVCVLVDCLPVGFWLVDRRHLFDMVIPPFDVHYFVDDLHPNQLLDAIVLRSTYELW